MEKGFLYKELTYKIIGYCMEVYKELGKGFSEVIYGDALEIEFRKNDINYSRKKKFNVDYKGIRLNRFYKAYVFIENKIILENKTNIELFSNIKIKNRIVSKFRTR